jgi:hypothetical protein
VRGGVLEGREADPLVLHASEEAAVALVEQNGHMAGADVLPRVRDGLLNDPISTTLMLAAGS